MNYQRQTGTSAAGQVRKGAVRSTPSLSRQTGAQRPLHTLQRCRAEQPVLMQDHRKATAGTAKHRKNTGESWLLLR